MFPSYQEYRRFLEVDPAREFEQGCYYRCAMAILGQGPVAEGYSSDIDLDASDWFYEHERRAKEQGMWQGKTAARDILAMLLEIDPEGCYPMYSTATLHRAQTVQFKGWRIRFDVAEPSAEFLANFARGTKGKLFEAVLDADKIGRGPFTMEGKHVMGGDQSLAVLGKKVGPQFLAGPGTVRTRHLRAYPL